MATTEERFWKYVKKTSGCWLWTGPKQTTGYGQIRVANSRTGAHRYSYELHYGSLPDGLLVLHKCDIPLCVNPDHLFIGTHQDNMDDMKSKGRGRGRGSQKRKTRRRIGLTDEQIQEIKRKYKGLDSQKDLAKEYGVFQYMIARLFR